VRPLELRLRSFRSYAGDDTVFSFRDRRLVGIVGPIGSGKSTILDAIAFALYGRTATIGRATRALIHQRADSTTVALRFEVDGEVWEVQRMLRRKGASQHALYRLDADVEEPEHLETVLQEADVNERLIDLLGLDFAAFGRSVMLAQGRFAEFLMAPPAERDKVLKGVFGHDRIDRMRDLAKAHAAELEIETEKVAFRAEHMAEAIQGADARREELAVVELRATTLDKARPDLEEVVAAEHAGAERRQAATDRIEELRALAERLPDTESSTTLLEAIEAAVDRRAAAAEQLEQATVALDTAEQALSALEGMGEREHLERAAQLLATQEVHETTLAAARTAEQREHDRLAAATEALANQGRAESEAVQTAHTAESDLAASEADLTAAQAALHAARHGDMAAALRSDLAAGEPCPVCEHVVVEVPPTAADPRLTAAERAVQAAEVERARLENQRSEAAAGLEAARSSLAASEARRDAAVAASELATEARIAAEVQLDGTARQVRDLLGSDDPRADLTVRRKRLGELADATGDTRRLLERVRVGHDEAIAAEQAARARGDALRMQLVDVSARLGMSDAVRSDDPSSVRQALGDLHASWEAEYTAVVAAAERAGRDQGEAEARRLALATSLDLTGSLSDELADARAKGAVLGEEIARAEALQTVLADVVTQRDALVDRRDVFRRLAGDLTDARFIRFLLDEERGRLAELGSDHFQRLSGGRYRFTEDGDFDIVDLTAAEAIRRADSLSGGETFLASLGLALALAEMVARTGGRLGAFFLDEGFGTLDPEHLDLAMEGVESLAAETASRLVVVVSHVAELRHRIEDLIELERSPTTGTTRVVRA
jgi:exonuclease SbcC